MGNCFSSGEPDKKPLRKIGRSNFGSQGRTLGGEDEQGMTAAQRSAAAAETRDVSFARTDLCTAQG